MTWAFDNILQNKKNMVFIGEAGCGKSEIALNFAMNLKRESPLAVHVFDLDQTKPIFRSRDARDILEQNHITLHHALHDFDSPTIVGGVAQCLEQSDCHALLDVGGGETGARIIGRFARILNAGDTMTFYVVNPYRPWSQNIEDIDSTLSSILHISRIKKIHVLLNPHIGADTNAEEFLTGLEKAKEMLLPHIQPECALVREELFDFDKVRAHAGMPLLPLRLYLKYEWLINEREV